MIGYSIVFAITLLLFLLILKYEVSIDKNWDGLYVVWCSKIRDIHGEYHKIYYSRKFINFKKK